MSSQENLVINHVAIGVPNCEDAASFYTSVFGFRVLKCATRDRRESPGSPMFAMYGSKLQRVKLVFMSAGNGVGFEIFEFVDPPHEANQRPPVKFEDGAYTRGGFFHIAVTSADPGALAARVVENGGRKISTEVDLFGETAIYIADPWENVIEVMSCSFERLVVGKTPGS
ncbi:uncharacterized protein A1O9_12580 [Exophiala aquamarina CBS 119918]|uniref:VOC domain-containing protein n=1 Tax=Exophiala aquamarina CBS 119918 TaxID=1182545 RepID=A0A072NUZ2_9EURO|nr:uncharacterized protein A1O9_12580 [Exophiala aquamarina CBS 119918]KEF51431.1 hypothetical protein A1O9_12580 [Exophiala aquamarina CBS 119918]